MRGLMHEFRGRRKAATMASIDTDKPEPARVNIDKIKIGTRVRILVTSIAPILTMILAVFLLLLETFPDLFTV